MSTPSTGADNDDSHDITANVQVLATLTASEESDPQLQADENSYRMDVDAEEFEICGLSDDHELQLQPMGFLQSAVMNHRTWASKEDAKTEIEILARRDGYLVRVRSTNVNYRRCTFECKRENCPWTGRLVEGEDGLFRFSVCSNSHSGKGELREHSHEPDNALILSMRSSTADSESQVNLVPGYRNLRALLPKDVKEEIISMYSASRLRKIDIFYEVDRRFASILPQPLQKATIYSLLRDRRANRDEEGWNLVLELQRLATSAVKNDFYYELHAEGGLLNHVSFAFHTWKLSYQACGGVMCVDSKAQTNHFNLPFVTAIGMTSTGHSCMMKQKSLTNGLCLHFCVVMDQFPRLYISIKTLQL